MADVAATVAAADAGPMQRIEIVGERRRARAVLAADIRRLRPRFLLPQDPDNLLLGKMRSLHLRPPLRRTLLKIGRVSGAQITD